MNGNRSLRLIIFLGIILSSHLIFGPSVSEAGTMKGNLNFFLGRKNLDNDDWEPLEDQGELGIKFDFRQKGWPINLAVDWLFAASDRKGGTKSETSEFDFGVRKIWDRYPTIRPFVGGGLGILKGTLDIEGVGKVSDDTFGPWLGGGLYWTLNSVFNIGFEARWSKGDVTIFGQDYDAGGTHLGLLLGYHF